MAQWSKDRQFFTNFDMGKDFRAAAYHPKIDLDMTIGRGLMERKWPTQQWVFTGTSADHHELARLGCRRDIWRKKRETDIVGRELLNSSYSGFFLVLEHSYIYTRVKC